MPPRLTRIYPVAGHYIPGIPAAEQDVSAAEAEALVATGAFTTEPPQEQEPDAPANEEDEA